MQRTFRSLPEVLRDRYQFRRTLHLANTPSFSTRSCARPQTAALRDQMQKDPRHPALSGCAAAADVELIRHEVELLSGEGHHLSLACFACKGSLCNNNKLHVFLPCKRISFTCRTYLQIYMIFQFSKNIREKFRQIFIRSEE